MHWLDEIVPGVVFGILAIVIIALVGIVGAAPTYFLWNWLMPEIFGLKAITFWQAWGIMFLSGILFNNPSPSESPKSDKK